jgi:hypothetical protein
VTAYRENVQNRKHFEGGVMRTIMLLPLMTTLTMPGRKLPYFDHGVRSECSY